jgi:carbon-monoxide dehydrogenase large subunit
MATSILGTAVRRVEDPVLLTGAGRYVADLVPGDAAHVVFVRSPLAHARIAGIDAESARQAPGVLAVVTAARIKEKKMNV